MIEQGSNGRFRKVTPLTVRPRIRSVPVTARRHVPDGDAVLVYTTQTRM